MAHFSKIPLVCTALMMCCGYANASLVGATVDGSIVFTSYPSLGNCFDPADAAGCRSSSATPPFAPTSSIQPQAIISEDDSDFPEPVFDDK